MTQIGGVAQSSMTQLCCPCAQNVTLPVVLQLYKNQEKVAEHIAAEGSKDAIAKVDFACSPLLLHLMSARPTAAKL